MSRLRAKSAFTCVFDALWRFAGPSNIRNFGLTSGKLVGSKL
jgi:hypothetical protein